MLPGDLRLGWASLKLKPQWTGECPSPESFLCEPQPLQKETGLETPGCAHALRRGFGTGAPDGGTRWPSVRIGAAMDAVTSLPRLTPDPRPPAQGPTR